VRCKHLIVEKFFSLSPQAVERLQLKEVHDVSCMHFFLLLYCTMFSSDRSRGCLIGLFLLTGVWCCEVL